MSGYAALHRTGGPAASVSPRPRSPGTGKARPSLPTSHNPRGSFLVRKAPIAPSASSAPVPLTHEAAVQQLVALQRDDREFVERLFVAREEHHERHFLLVEEDHARQMLLNVQFAEATELEAELAHLERRRDVLAEIDDGGGPIAASISEALRDELSAADEMCRRAMALRDELQRHDAEREEYVAVSRRSIDMERTDLYVYLSELENRVRELEASEKDALIRANFPHVDFERRSAAEAYPVLLPHSRSSPSRTRPASSTLFMASIVRDVADVVERSNRALASVADILSGLPDNRGSEVLS